MRLERHQSTPPPRANTALPPHSNGNTTTHPAAMPPLQPPPPDERHTMTMGRKGKRRAEQSNAPIVPAGSVTGRSLTLVVVIMCFLACLTAGAVYMMNQSASAWLHNIASEVTVQVEPRAGINTDKVVKDVTALLRRTRGVNKVTALAMADSAKLLEPWLGNSDILKSLPVPRLIALQLNRSAPPNFKTLRTRLKANFKGVTLDDHRHWQKQIRTVTRSFALGGLGILVLVALATAAIIVSATRSSMASNREIVEVLHFVGATDKFIAHEFERHFLALGVRAGLFGAGLAVLVFFLVPAVMELLGGGSVTATELQRLIGTGTLDYGGYLVLGLVVAIVAGLCMVTSRVGVHHILNVRSE